MPLNALPPVINGVLEARISFNRLRTYLSQPEHAAKTTLGPSKHANGTARQALSLPSMRQQQQQQNQQLLDRKSADADLQHASFSRSGTKPVMQQGQMGQSSLCLRDISLIIPRGRLTVVVGDVSCV